MQRCVDSMISGDWINNEFDKELTRLVNAYQASVVKNLKVADHFGAHLQALESGSFDQYISNQENAILLPKKRRRRRDENSNSLFTKVPTALSKFSSYKEPADVHSSAKKSAHIDLDMPAFDAIIPGISRINPQMFYIASVPALHVYFLCTYLKMSIRHVLYYIPEW